LVRERRGADATVGMLLTIDHQLHTVKPVCN
jgi:hypothetical protein